MRFELVLGQDTAPPCPGRGSEMARSFKRFQCHSTAPSFSVQLNIHIRAMRAALYRVDFIMFFLPARVVLLIFSFFLALPLPRNGFCISPIVWPSALSATHSVCIGCKGRCNAYTLLIGLYPRHDSVGSTDGVPVRHRRIFPVPSQKHFAPLCANHKKP